MIDKELFRLIGGNKKYIFIAVALQVLGLIANVSITASVCYAVYLLSKNAEAVLFIYPLIGAVLGIAVRYTCSRITGDIKDKLGRGVKRDLREKVYNKILRLGVKTTDGMSMAGLTQVSLEGVEQLDIYFSSYLPQFFFAMIAPVALFLICVWIDWRTALVLICCVPLIPVSIVAVSKYAKKVFAKYWGKYTSMGDKFLDSVQGLKELKIFQADAAQHVKINESAEEFRVITMKVLVMQLVSITIMDLVAYGGAGIGIGLAICDAAFWGLNPIAALFLCLVSVEFFLPLRAFGSAFHVAMNGVSAGKKIISLLNTPDPEWGTETLDGNKDIRLENVTFSYDGKLKGFIEENGGLDKVITEDANNISGGQKQRLALAIALVSDKDIYVFDEATSNIDIDSESIIMNNIKTLSGNRGVIVISHRLANVVPADNIYYMEDGEIKESGAHDELMAANKGYARLYNTQKTLEQGYTEAIA